jgi:DNA repair protein RadC
VAAIGTATGVVFEPVEVYRNAILARASSIIVVHNHPSGSCKPSRADLKVAARLKELGEIHEMPLQDFVIIGEGRFHSYREHGPSSEEL